MNLPPNVSAVPDRHGKIRYRFRKKGYPSRYVQGEPGSTEFAASYEDCHDRSYVPRPRSRLRHRSRKIDPRHYVGGQWVYFIGAMNGPVKIGTTINLPERLKKIQTGCPMKVHVLACVEGGAALEAEYHAKFSHLKVSGEWFRGAEIRAEIRRIRNASLSNLRLGWTPGACKNGGKAYVSE